MDEDTRQKMIAYMERYEAPEKWEELHHQVFDDPDGVLLAWLCMVCKVGGDGCFYVPYVKANDIAGIPGSWVGWVTHINKEEDGLHHHITLRGHDKRVRDYLLPLLKMETHHE